MHFYSCFSSDILVIIVDDFLVFYFALDGGQNRVLIFVVFVFFVIASAVVVDLVDFFDFCANVGQNLFLFDKTV